MLLQGKLRQLAVIQVLQRRLDAMDQVLALPRTTRASTTAKEASGASEKLREQVLGVHTATHTAFAETLSSKAVIHFALTRV